MIDSAKNQSGNVAGALGTAVAGVALAPFVAAGAPLILIGLGIGVGAQVLWNGFGANDWAEEQAKKWMKD